MDNGNLKRITVFAGHYGSGKTNIAINYAINAAASGIKTAIADLDIVNPYFRTKDAAKLLSESGVRPRPTPTPMLIRRRFLRRHIPSYMTILSMR